MLVVVDEVGYTLFEITNNIHTYLDCKKSLLLFGLFVCLAQTIM